MNSTAPAVLLALLLAACAQIREPQGGPKDTTPPQLISAEPANGSMRFSQNQIVLHFDEKVRLHRVSEKLLVSPPLAKAPSVQVVRGSNVVIGLNAPLAANTTYTFNIGEAVQDLSEGNPAAGLAFVVSTGNHVDSLSVAGAVTEAATGLPAKDVLVLLHGTSDTGDVRTAPPDYFTRTGTDGRFTLTHLRGGATNLYALKDLNGNYRYDLPNEEIAFLDAPVHPGDSVEHRLFLFLAPSPTQFIAGAKVLEERGWQIVFARHAGEVALRPLDRQGGALTWWQEWSENRDTAVFWPSDTTLLNGQRFIVMEQDSVLDTLTFRPTKPMPFNLTLSASRDRETGDLWLNSSRPVASVDADRTELRVDSAVVAWVPQLDSTRMQVIGINLHPEAGSQVSLVLLPKAVQGVMGGTNDTTRLQLGVPAPRTMGKLAVALTVDSGLTPPRGPWVLQLLTGPGHAVREALLDSLPGTVHWKDLDPGRYSLKLIADRNGDQRWTTGSLMPPVQPERIFLLKDPVTIRAGWSVETAWNLGEQP